MPVIEQARAAARRRRARVVFPELHDPRVAQAAARLDREGLAHPVPLAPVSDGQIAALLARRPMKPALAARMLQKPLMRAAAMVAAGEAEAMVAGAEAPTRRVIEAAAMCIGLAPGVTVPSSFFVMSLPDGREFIFADCAVNVAPDAEALAAIATASAATARAVLGAARVALLSFSTGSSGQGDSVTRVAQAAQIAGLPGPVQADAALNATIAAQKGVALEAAANTLIFPSLDAGNIAYKLLQELAGARAIGPVLQGFAKPVCDLSRGAST
ncbi:hypothetical protein LCGC14_2976630, partial [marine sediment metagenome]